MARKKTPTPKQKETVLFMTKHLNNLKLKLIRTRKGTKSYKVLDKLIDTTQAEMNKYRKSVGMDTVTRLK